MNKEELSIDIAVVEDMIKEQLLLIEKLKLEVKKGQSILEQLKKLYEIENNVVDGGDDINE